MDKEKIKTIVGTIIVIVIGFLIVSWTYGAKVEVKDGETTCYNIYGKQVGCR